MMKEMKMKQKSPPQKIIEDAILTGILKAMGCDYLPMRDQFTRRVVFKISGDVDEALEQIYKNKPVGALTVLHAIKAARQAIFNFKGNGDDYGKDKF
jgi:hypothetical protein